LHIRSVCLKFKGSLKTDNPLPMSACTHFLPHTYYYYIREVCTALTSNRYIARHSQTELHTAVRQNRQWYAQIMHDTWFPGVWILIANVSERSVCSIFMKTEQSVTQKKAYNTQNTAKVWNQEWYLIFTVYAKPRSVFDWPTGALLVATL